MILHYERYITSDEIELIRLFRRFDKRNRLKLLGFISVKLDEYLLDN